MDETSDIPPEFSRPVRLAEVAKHDVHAEWAATGAECEALTRRYAIVAVHALEALVTMSPLGGGCVQARISLKADVEQRSVISLDNVRERLEKAVTVRYLTAKRARDYERLLEDDGLEPPDEDIEVIDGESIDIGETIAQQLSLALDPYPRKGGETFEVMGEVAGIASDADGRSDRPNPFEVLKNFKQNS